MVNSCDAYSDLWNPFFTLLKKYWLPCDLKIVLNTETNDFSFDGMDIEVIHSPKGWPYGKRMINVLKHIRTKYVFVLLDDFFLRQPVDMQRITRIISWMEQDPEIVCFSSDCTQTYADWEIEKYHGFRRVPPGNEYMLNLQAAVWRTEAFREYWNPKVTPWEWEEYSSVLTGKHPKHKFYCTIDWNYSICDYGYNAKGMGVFHGQWVIEDVKPLFEKENIDVDYSKRGVYCGEIKRKETHWPTTNWEWINKVYRCMGWKEIFPFLIFCMVKRLPWKRHMRRKDYFTYLSEKQKMSFEMHLGKEVA